MPTAKGFINSVPGTAGRFSASFLVNKVLYNASGSFDSTVPAFSCSNAMLKFDDISDLTSTHSLSGHIGITDIGLTFDNGPTITGALNMPINPSSNVSGWAVWTQN